MRYQKVRAAFAAEAKLLSRKSFKIILAVCLFLNSVPAIALSENPVPLQKGFIFIGGQASGPKNYTPYLSATGASAEQTLFLQIDHNSFTANHVRDYAMMKKQYEQLEAHSPGGIVLFAFSAGGKFAFKLSEDHVSSARGLFLLDPVDGGPSTSNKATHFPDFIDEKTCDLEIPTVLLETEFGPKPVILGMSCVPPKDGPHHFAPHINPAFLKWILLAGAGHADFLYPPLNPLAKIGCGKSKVNSESVRAQTLDLWKDFLGKL